MSAATRSTCPYCGVGCGVEARAADNGDWTVRGDDEHPANRGRLCVKGTALAETLGLEDRLLYPEIHGRRVGWEQALDTVALGFSRIIEAHGPEAVAFYLSGQLLTEDYYVANKLMKGFIGSANVDTNSRLCMSTAVAAHQRAFGADLVPGCYDDLELADLVLLVGSNLAWTHPVVFQRLAAAKQARPDMKVVVVDPRRSATCELADLHLALRPGSDGHLFVGLLSELAQRGRIDAEYIGSHTTGFAGALAAALASVPDAAAIAVACDLNTDAVARFCAWFAATERTVTLFSQGINQSSSGVDKANAIINCHLATGRIGRPGAAPFSITGQPNAMGGREVGGLANQLAAHMVFESAADRDRVARFWKAPRLAGCAGLKAVPLFDAVAAGRVKAIWIMATNPVVSLPDADRVRAALAGCELVVVSDCVRNTDTTALADVLLPALTWGEKDGTVTNSERMISRQRAFLKPPGEARPDWKIVTALARRLGYGEAFPYRHPAEIFREHAALTAFENDGSRTLDLGALARLKPHAYEALEPVQWPVPIDRPQGTPRLFADARFATPDGRARLLSVAPQFPPEEPGIGRTMMLNTGRVRDQWHTMTRTAKSARLLQHTPEPYAEIHPEDAGALGVKEHELLRLQARGAQLVARVRCSPQPRRGSVFVPMHWNLRYAAKARVGPLIAPVLDPISGQPALKHAQVTAARFPTRWQGMLLTRAPVAPPVVGYWCRVPQADHELWYLADDETLSNPAALARTVLGKAGAWLELEDESAGIYRCAQIVDGRLEGVLMLSTGPGLPSTEWLATLFSAREVSLTDRRRLLAASPGAAGPDPGPIVCCCHRVHLDPIVAAVTRGLETTKALGAALRCGTQCGSCLPELQQLITEHRRARVA